MKFSLPAAALAAAAVISGAAAAAQEWWGVPTGLGLKPSGDAGLAWASGMEYAVTAPAVRTGDYTLFAGVRELPRLGLRATESYSGLFYAPSDTWSSAFETRVAQESWSVPRRYSLAGRIQAALPEGRGLSVGLRYSMYEPGAATPPSLAGDPGWIVGPSAYGFGRMLGAALAPSYQLQLSYQHSAASSFSLALGREIETFTPGFDVPGNGTRQLTFTGQHWLTPSWAVGYDVLSSDPGNPFRLQGLRLGVRYRF